jgi:integrase
MAEKSPEGPETSSTGTTDPGFSGDFSMSAEAQKAPKYRHYKPKDLAVVRISGKDHYLGKFNSPESYEKYHRLLAERYSRGPSTPSQNQQTRPASESLTITQLCVGYYRHAERYYVKNGQVTNQVRMIRLSLEVLQKLYGSTLAKEFGPVALRACQAQFIRDGLSRGECNRRTSLIKGAFKWGVTQELVSGPVWQGLLAVGGLRKGRTEAREPVPVGPVPDAIVERTLENLCPTVAAMVRLQLATAMRPGELVLLKVRDLDMSGPVWEYKPGTFKTEHHEEKCRVVMIGPKGQEIIRPFLTLDISGYLFSPQRALDEQAAERRADRKTPLYDAHVKHQAKRRKARGRRPLGEHYTVNAYRIAIARACDQAFPYPDTPQRLDGESARAFRHRLATWRETNAKELQAWKKSHRWHPHQLRHSAATAIRKQYGAESSQAVLGHAQLHTTEIYAQRDMEVARRIMREIG